MVDALTLAYGWHVTEASSYLLLDRIAAGGMAEVFRAKSLGVEGFEKIIAMKRILPHLAEDEEFVAMFVHEAKIAGQLNHANIGQIYDLGRIGGQHFIAMEYIWGKDLQRILKRFRQLGQPMPPPMAAWIAAQMTAALDYAHRKRGPDGRPLGIIHRDVSPANVLVSYDGLVKLIDFGIAKAASRASQTQAGIIKGKLAFMSPEQVRGRPIDHRSDIFAASTVLHQLLTGRRLFHGTSDIEILEGVRDARAEPPSASAPHVPPALDAIVMKGLAREPDDRYRLAEEMHEDLMQFIMSNRPPYGTSDLSGWMRVAFAPEMAAEREHHSRLLHVSGAGVRVSDEVPRESQPEEELSQILILEDVMSAISGMSAAAEAPRPAVEEPRPALESEPPLPFPEIIENEPPPFASPAHVQSKLHAASPVGPAPVSPASLPSVPLAAPALAGSSIATPRVPSTSLTPPEAARPKRRRWPLVLVGLVVFLGAAAGAAVWILRFGGRALLGF